MEIETVPLNHCTYYKETKKLSLSSEYFGGSFPREFFVHSHHTGKDVRFVAIQYGDLLFDEDHWDGEQMVYRPTSNQCKVDHLVLYHEF